MEGDALQRKRLDAAIRFAVKERYSVNGSVARRDAQGACQVAPYRLVRIAPHLRVLHAHPRGRHAPQPRRAVGKPGRHLCDPLSRELVVIKRALALLHRAIALGAEHGDLFARTANGVADAQIPVGIVRTLFSKRLQLKLWIEMEQRR